MIRKFMILLSVVFVVSACMSTASYQSPEAFRKNKDEAHTRFTAQRKYSAVSSDIRMLANKCLAVSTTSVSSQPMGKGMYRTVSLTTNYTPTVLVKGKKTELHLQSSAGSSIKIYDEPKDGFYMLVADVVDNGKGGVTADIYSFKSSFDDRIEKVAKQVEAWIRGTSKQCPDL